MTDKPTTVTVTIQHVRLREWGDPFYRLSEEFAPMVSVSLQDGTALLFDSPEAMRQFGNALAAAGRRLANED